MIFTLLATLKAESPGTCGISSNEGTEVANGMVTSENLYDFAVLSVDSLKVYINMASMTSLRCKTCT